MVGRRCRRRFPPCALSREHRGHPAVRGGGDARLSGTGGAFGRSRRSGCGTTRCAGAEAGPRSARARWPHGSHSVRRRGSRSRSRIEDGVRRRDDRDRGGEAAARSRRGRESARQKRPRRLPSRTPSPVHILVSSLLCDSRHRVSLPDFNDNNYHHLSAHVIHISGECVNPPMLRPIERPIERLRERRRQRAGWPSDPARCRTLSPEAPRTGG